MVYSLITSVLCVAEIVFVSQVTLIPEEAEDMWHTYNLVQVGDSLRASTIRYHNPMHTLAHTSLLHA